MPFIGDSTFCALRPTTIALVSVTIGFAPRSENAMRGSLYTQIIQVEADAATDESPR